MFRFSVRAPDGAPLRAVGELTWRDPSGDARSERVETCGNGVLEFGAVGIPMTLVVMPLVPGFWSACWSMPTHGLDVVMDPIASDVEKWWLHPLGAHDARREGALLLGDGIRIGVIDTGFLTSDGIEHVHGLPSGGTARGQFSHGEAVCRLLGDRSFPSTAPASEIYFRAADGASEKLDLAWVCSRIGELVDEDEVDLICVSAGVAVEAAPSDPDHPLAGLRDMIEVARESGVLCFASAGSNGESPVVAPACFDRCVAVGAIGWRHFGPLRSLARWYSDRATRTSDLGGREVFHWSSSGHGEGLNVVAPGVGVVVGREGRPAWDVIGSSFSAPLACGTLAVALSGDATYKSMPRTAARADHALEVLSEICMGLPGLGPKYGGMGCPR